MLFAVLSWSLGCGMSMNGAAAVDASLPPITLLSVGMVGGLVSLATYVILVRLW